MSILDIFKSKPKPRKPSQRRDSLDQQERRLDFQRKKAAHSLWMTDISNLSEDERRDYIGQALGQKLKPKVVKPIEERIFDEELQNNPEFRDQVMKAKLDALRGQTNIAAELDRKITDSALAQLESNPELMKTVVGRKIDELVGSRKPGDALGEFLGQMDMVDDLKARFGSKDSGWGSLLNPQLIDSVVKLLPPLLNRGVPYQPDQSDQTKVYVVETGNGHSRELTSEEYIQYLERKQTMALPEGKEPPVADTPIQPADEGFDLKEPDLKEPELPNDFILRQIVSAVRHWAAFLEKSPREFVVALADGYRKGETAASLAISFITEAKDGKGLLFTLDEKLQPYSDNAEVAEFLDKIETREEWLGEVVLLLEKS